MNIEQQPYVTPPRNSGQGIYAEQQKVYWYSGLYLQPQHFQSMDLHQEWILAQQRCLAHPYYAGVIDCRINQSVLSDYIIDIESLSVILPHGEHLMYPGNCRVEKRIFRDAWKQKEQTFTLWLALRQFDPAHCNVAIAGDDREQTNTRWINAGDESVMKDVYDRGPDASIARIYYNARIVWDQERDNLVDAQCIPLLRLRYDDDGVSIDADFSPPALTLYAMPMLGKVIDDIYYELSHRAKKLEEYKRPERLTRVSGGDDQMTQLLAMRSLNRALPMLKHYRDARRVHPWEVYGLLCQLVGELSSFNDACSFLGEWHQGGDALLPYDHQNLIACFGSAKKAIVALLNGLVLEENTYVTLEHEHHGVYHCALDQPLGQTPVGSILLLLRSALFTKHRASEPTESLKLASRQSLEALIQHALPGIPLKLCQPVPRGVPNRSDSCYWELTRDSDLWKNALQEQSIAFYWPEAPADLQVQIVFMAAQ
ncbi:MULTISPECIES: type VI secretion system baseplate subunit TssK [Hafnia]|uniref:Type VI secretion protein, VC_A0114 family n=1 Tax=Hafnia alvei ATCC 51873 TaxID=1002364 RepID=G9Y4T0_HAFAL|nr:MULTISPECIES: type VI secretion system baseplate subunit TssK [Hafnia]EHM44281.1 type VI secretion protein, VC_A0114 family [Hafnia alvei ATCC 51873]